MPREQLWPRSDTEVGGRARVQRNKTSPAPGKQRGRRWARLFWSPDGCCCESRGIINKIKSKKDYDVRIPCSSQHRWQCVVVSWGIAIPG